jgi:hypothetical protein
MIAQLVQQQLCNLMGQGLVKIPPGPELKMIVCFTSDVYACNTLVCCNLSKWQVTKLDLSLSWSLNLQVLSQSALFQLFLYL